MFQNDVKNELKPFEKCTEISLPSQCKKNNYQNDIHENVRHHVQNKLDPDHCLEYDDKSRIKKIIKTDVESDYDASENAILCLKCYKTFASISSFKTHKYIICEKQLNLQCPFCTFNTMHKRNLQMHLKRKICSKNEKVMKNNSKNISRISNDVERIGFFASGKLLFK